MNKRNFLKNISIEKILTLKMSLSRISEYTTSIRLNPGAPQLANAGKRPTTSCPPPLLKVLCDPRFRVPRWCHFWLWLRSAWHFFNQCSTFFDVATITDLIPFWKEYLDNNFLRHNQISVKNPPIIGYSNTTCWFYCSISFVDLGCVISSEILL